MKAFFAIVFLAGAVLLLLVIDKLKRSNGECIHYPHKEHDVVHQEPERPPGYGLALNWKRYPKGWTKKLW